MTWRKIILIIWQIWLHISALLVLGAIIFIAMLDVSSYEDEGIPDYALCFQNGGDWDHPQNACMYNDVDPTFWLRRQRCWHTGSLDPEADGTCQDYMMQPLDLGVPPSSVD